MYYSYHGKFQGRRAAQTSGMSTPILSPTEKCLTNLTSKICYVSLKFKPFCINMLLNCFLIKLFLISESFLFKIGLFFFWFSSLIFAKFHDQLQSDSIYSPIPGTSIDVPDVPSPSPHVIHARTLSSPNQKDAHVSPSASFQSWTVPK